MSAFIEHAPENLISGPEIAKLSTPLNPNIRIVLNLPLANVSRESWFQ